MVMRRFLAAACCLLIANEGGIQLVHGRRLKGTREAKLGRRELQLPSDFSATTAPVSSLYGMTPPPQGGTTMPPNGVYPPPPPPPTSPTTKAPKTGGQTYAYTWNSDDPADDGAYATVDKSKHDEMMDKVKNGGKGKGSYQEDDYSEDAPKMGGKGKGSYQGDDSEDEMSPKTTNNRPPGPVSGDVPPPPPAPQNKASKGSDGSLKSSGGGGVKGSTNNKNNKGTTTETYENQKKNKNGDTKATKLGGSASKKGSSGSKKGSGGKQKGSQGGDSGDGYGGDGYGSAYDDKGSKKSRGSAKASSSGDTKESGAAKGTPLGPPPGPPGNGFQGADGTPLAGVPVSRFALMYSIDHSGSMPMTMDYEAVHENTYLWLYTVMYQQYGDRLMNLLTDDTSNIYELNQPITIEYASVVLFDQSDPDIPTRQDLDQYVMQAFSGDNLNTYLNGIQSLPQSNPFRTTSSIQLQQVSEIEGRSIVGNVINRVSTKGMMPTMMSAAALFVFLAAGVAVYKNRDSNGYEDVKGKPFDGVSHGDTATTMDDYTNSVRTVTIKTKTKIGSPGWDLSLNDESEARLSAISERSVDPDLIGFDFFDDEPPTSPNSNDGHSQYSIEDFVDEAERNLLGARIRYPSDSKNATDPPAITSGEQQETSTALVPAPPSSIVPVAPFAI